MSSNLTTETPATAFLRQHNINYTSHFYKYEEHGGTSVSSRELQVSEHEVIKTLIMQDEKKQPLVVLMHGDCQVSTKELARQLGRKKIEICDPSVANRHSGFLVGGTSPFGTRKKMPVCIEESILALPWIYINGGRRGFLVCLDPADIVKSLAPEIVKAAIVS
ncbi:Cys-tRNA(Pro) deacylase [Cupriavidus sp. WKF15]|uniref:Cys-tRNA(Pro) deacylase n=1 Tax=Cupriavidus sp. WKF15 TaxID=3032282 RepID=UPI0023E3168C|nr:Cys-tRNA(Pro) deacylase [Cupriavidus sp. WKF15]WER46576.1 Cys-tRNA(Pro) deacylase [Cupriavidus sp. WKF15]